MVSLFEIGLKCYGCVLFDDGDIFGDFLVLGIFIILLDMGGVYGVFVVNIDVYDVDECVMVLEMM